MASPSSTTPSFTVAKRNSSSSALMAPPPPPKRIKRPPKVVDEDDYTEALSQIIARDYFPGLLESKIQQEYLSALESNNPIWIAEAGLKLQEVMTPGPHTRLRQARAARNSRFNTPVPGHVTPYSRGTPGATPRGFRGDETPISSAAGTEDIPTTTNLEIDTLTLSLSTFQSKYTSEDNESFNALLDKQNVKRRSKYAHLWAPDQRIPSARQIAHRDREAKLLKQKAQDKATGKELVPITSGAGTADRPARPDSWKIKMPDSTFMFPPSSIDEDGLETVAESRERTSRAGPKGVIHANTRFTTPSLQDPNPTIPPSPSLSAIRDAISGRPHLSASDIQDLTTSTGNGGDTPRVNGYAFVDEDEPDNTPAESDVEIPPTYRDLLAGQVGDGTPNPFKIGEVRRREDLHHRMVEREARKKRKSHQPGFSADAGGGEGRGGDGTVPRFPSSPTVGAGKTLRNDGGGGSAPAGGGLTPAAKRLLDRVGRTPVPRAGHGTGSGGDQGGSGSGSGSRLRNMWTPTLTPRRKAGV